MHILIKYILHPERQQKNFWCFIVTPVLLLGCMEEPKKPVSPHTETVAAPEPQKIIKKIDPQPDPPMTQGDAKQEQNHETDDQDSEDQDTEKETKAVSKGIYSRVKDFFSKYGSEVKTLALGIGLGGAAGYLMKASHAIKQHNQHRRQELIRLGPPYWPSLSWPIEYSVHDALRYDAYYFLLHLYKMLSAQEDSKDFINAQANDASLIALQSLAGVFSDSLRTAEKREPLCMLQASKDYKKVRGFFRIEKHISEEIEHIKTAVNSVSTGNLSLTQAVRAVSERLLSPVVITEQVLFDEVDVGESFEFPQDLGDVPKLLVATLKNPKHFKDWKLEYRWHRNGKSGRCVTVGVLLSDPNLALDRPVVDKGATKFPLVTYSLLGGATKRILHEAPYVRGEIHPTSLSAIAEYPVELVLMRCDVK